MIYIMNTLLLSLLKSILSFHLCSSDVVHSAHSILLTKWNEPKVRGTKSGEAE